MKVIVKSLFAAFALALAMLIVPPTIVEAQGTGMCLGCENDDDGGPQHCNWVGEGYANCVVMSGFCQLQGLCTFAYLDMPADTEITPAGTLLPALTDEAVAFLKVQPRASCSDFVIVATDPIEERLVVILLE